MDYGSVGATDEELGRRLLDALDVCAPALPLDELDLWSTDVCEAVPDLCRELAEVAADQRRLQESADVDVYAARLDELREACARCTEAVNYDNRLLLIDCENSDLPEACRRLEQVQERRCGSKCRPALRCRTCIEDLVNSYTMDGAARLVRERCRQDCR